MMGCCVTYSTWVCTSKVMVTLTGQLKIPVQSRGRCVAHNTWVLTSKVKVTLRSFFFIKLPPSIVLNCKVGLTFCPWQFVFLVSSWWKTALDFPNLEEYKTRFFP